MCRLELFASFDVMLSWKSRVASWGDISQPRIKLCIDVQVSTFTSTVAWKFDKATNFKVRHPFPTPSEHKDPPTASTARHCPPQRPSTTFTALTVLHNHPSPTVEAFSPPCLNERSSPSTTRPTSIPRRSYARERRSKQAPKSKPFD